MLSTRDGIVKHLRPLMTNGYELTTAGLSTLVIRHVEYDGSLVLTIDDECDLTVMFNLCDAFEAYVDREDWNDEH